MRSASQGYKVTSKLPATSEPSTQAGGDVEIKAVSQGPQPAGVRPASFTRRAITSFLPSSMPLMARANYRHELVAALFLPFMLTGVETGVVTVLIRNAFDGIVADGMLNWAVSFIGSTKALANIVSFMWVRLNHGRNKIHFIVSLQWSMAVMVLMLAFVPKTPVGLAVFAVGILLARVIWSGFITVRSTIWNANYDRDLRARVTGKTATVQVLIVGFLGLGMGWAMDLNDSSFRYLFIAGALMSVLGIISWSRVRVRGHRKLLRDEKSDSDGQLSFNPFSIFQVLAQDKPFAGYMACMFLFGTGNLMLPALLAIVLKERFGMAYTGGMLITNSIPLLVMPIFVPLWARLLQKVHVVRFRLWHSWSFVLANVFVTAAALLNDPMYAFIGAAMHGGAFAGGALAWTLGHLDFAPPHRASQYMGVHVTLTGVRGVIAPFLGVGIYEGLKRINPDYGPWVFFIILALNLAGAVGFIILARWMRAGGLLRTEPIETTPPSRAGV